MVESAVSQRDTCLQKFDLSLGRWVLQRLALGAEVPILLVLRKLLALRDLQQPGFFEGLFQMRVWPCVWIGRSIFVGLAVVVPRSSLLLYDVRVDLRV